MYCSNQQYQPWAIPQTEAVLDAQFPLLQEAQSANPIAAILDRLMAVVSKLETRLDDRDRFVGEFRPPVQPQPDPDPLYNQPPYYGAVMRPLDNHQHDYQQPRNGIQPLRPDYPPPHTDFQHHHNKDPHSWWQNLNLGLYTPDTAQQPPFTGFDSCGVGEISAPPVPGPPLHSATDQLYDLSPWETPGQRALHEYASYDQPPPHPPCCWDPLAQRALSGYPPPNQSHHVQPPQRDPTPPYGAPSDGPFAWDYHVQQQQEACDQQQYEVWLDYYNQTQTEISAASTPSWRPESTSFDVAPMQSVAATKFESEEGIYSYVYGSKHRMREQVGGMSDSLILDAQVEYSYDDPKDFDYVSDRGMVEGEHCDIPERDSILATEATKIIDREATYSHTGNVSNQAIVVTSNISGEEGKLFDDEPPQPSPMLQLYTLDVSEEEEALFEDKVEEDSVGEVKEINTSIHVARVSSHDVENCWNKRGGAYTALKIIIYGDLFICDVKGTIHRSTSLDADARFVPLRHCTPFLRFPASSSWFQVSRVVWGFLMSKCMGLSHLKHKCGLFSSKKSSGSYMSYPNVDFFLKVFDPGGDNTRLLLSLTLLIASWIPP